MANCQPVKWTDIKPKLIVFDLDYTLWPYWVDTHVTLPFRKDGNGRVYDRQGEHLVSYADVPKMLESLQSQGIKLGIASRTSALEEATELVRLFDWEKHFEYRQIYPGSKITHFKRIKAESGIEFKDMIFFDDEHRNIVEVGGLGVTAVYVDKGMTNNVLLEGLNQYRSKVKSL